MDRDLWRIIVFFVFLTFILPAIGILTLGILTKNKLEIIISIIFASGIFAFLYTIIYDIFADIYNEIDELREEIEKIKKKK